jgi:hypothetical protein
LYFVEGEAMERTRKEYRGIWVTKLISLFILVFIAVLFVNYVSVMEVAAKDSKASETVCDVTLLDPFTLTVFQLLESHPISIESKITLTERHQIRAPYKPPWPPPQRK